MRTNALGYCSHVVARWGHLARMGAVVGLATLALAGCQFGTDAFQAKFTRTQELTAPLADITGIQVSTDVGALRLEAGEVAEARIIAQIKVKARTEEEAEQWAEAVKIVAAPKGPTLVIQAERPSGLRQNQLSVDFNITAPGRLALDCVANVGDVHAAGFTARVTVGTDVGAIACTGLRGAADLRADVGDIRAEYAADAPANLDVRLATNVGNIEFRGPEQISAQLTAATDVGSIDTDRPLTVLGSMKQTVKATLGNGEGQVHLSTDVGSIRIR